MPPHTLGVGPAVLPYAGLNAADLARMYRVMYLSRRIDERQVQLKQQQRTFFQLSCAGHEAVLVAAGHALKAGYDWFFPYYRDQALALMLGTSALDALLEAVGAGAGPFSGGRQMPGHWANPALHLVSRSSATGMHFLHAVGCAEAILHLERQGRITDVHGDEVVCVSSGEGATSEGEFWEAVCAAATRRAPVLFLIEDNGYAISVPAEVQTPGGNISKLLDGIPHLLVSTCDGTDPIDSYTVLADAVRYCRARTGPALVHARVIRAHSHSNSDDHRLYRPAEERESDLLLDPIPRFRKFLLTERILGESHLDRLEHEIEQEVADASERALAAPAPDPATLTTHVYSSDIDPTSDAFSTAPRADGDPRTMVELINACLSDEMERDNRIVVFGEDVADASRDVLDCVKGKGGVFKATAGLQRRFGSNRVWNTPIAEAGIVGRAIGLALRGVKPVAEVQFFDYIWPAMMQIRDEMATLRWRSKGQFKCPLVLRAPIGGYLTGGGPYHSQSGEVTFTHIPGLRVVMPSTALDANGLLRTALRSDDPVLFLEPKHLYRQVHNRAPYPGADYMIPFGKANVVREGNDLTIVTYGTTVIRAVQAAATLAAEDRRSAEVLDLRSLNPYDWPAIVRSVRKTSRVLVVHEDWLSWGYGAEIAARIGDELFDDLDAPVRRVGAVDAFCGYNPALEDRTLPQTADILAASRTLLAY
jgi:2-oxoisovalerate dehydrogenase E1 component